MNSLGEVTDRQDCSDILPAATINCDVHPVVAGGLTGLAPFMPRAWNERLARKGIGVALLNCLQAGGVWQAQAQVDESIVPARTYNDFLSILG